MEKKLTRRDRFWNFCSRPFRKFENKHPEFYRKHRDLIGSSICGIMGSVITYLVCSFMPYIFGQYLCEVEFLLPDVPMQFHDVYYHWSIIGFAVRIRDGEAIIGGGIGYSLSFYLANIATHAVSFAFLRRFHHSTQNPYKQYFIGLGFCFATSIIGNMINGLWLPIVNAKLTFLEYNLIVLFVVGIVNFIVGHFQNLIIYKNDSKLNQRLNEIEAKKEKKHHKDDVIEDTNIANSDISNENIEVKEGDNPKNMVE